MTIVIAPLMGLLLTPAAWGLIAAAAERRHQRAHDDAVELQAIDQWLTAIRRA